MPDGSEQYTAVRERWAALMNGALRDANIEARVDHRSLAAQGIDRQPMVHVPMEFYRGKVEELDPGVRARLRGGLQSASRCPRGTFEPTRARRKRPVRRTRRRSIRGALRKSAATPCNPGCACGQRRRKVTPKSSPPWTTAKSDTRSAVRDPIESGNPAWSRSPAWTVSPIEMPHPHPRRLLRTTPACSIESAAFSLPDGRLLSGPPEWLLFARVTSIPREDAASSPRHRVSYALG